MNKQKYINYRNNQYLYSDDNWKTINITKDNNIPPGYKNDTNINHHLEIKLKFRYGLRPGNYLIKELKKIGKIRENTTGIPINQKQGYGDEFEILCLNVLHNLEYGDAIKKHLVVGDADGGIDAIYYDRNKRECVAYQIKLTDLNDSYLERMRNSIDLYIGGTLRQQPNSNDLANFLDENLPDIVSYKIKYRTISENGRLSSNIKSHSIFDKFLDKKTLLSSTNRKLRIRLESSIKGNMTVAQSPNKDILFIFVSATKFLEDLIYCYGDDMDAAFVNNVRGFDGENNDMVNTVERNPSKFCSYNNGISITGVCNIDPDDASHFIEVNNTCVVNGQQTIYNLYKLYKDGKNISRVCLPVFIKNASNNKEQSKIARFNNSQKSVTQLDLLSIDDNIRKLQKQLINNLDEDDNNIYYLNIVSTGEKGIVCNAKNIFGRNNIIKLADFVKLYSVVRNPKQLGQWKNNLNDQIKNTYNGEFPNCPLEDGKKICKCIIDSKAIISLNRSEYAIADLAIQYLLYLGISSDKVKTIIDKTNNYYKDRVKKKADIYKSNYAIFRVLRYTPPKYRPSIQLQEDESE